MGLRIFAVALVLLALLPAPSATAQSFLDALFGLSVPSPSRSYGRTRTQRERREYTRPREPQQVRAYYNSPANYERSGTYRTYCVRMCDGFYFPVSYASSSRNLNRDAQKCAQSCEGARLFYHRTGGDPEEMVDLNGKSYTSHPIAFKHRTELVQGCQCRPAPWTETEMERHRGYASKSKPVPVQSKIPPGRSSKGAAASTPATSMHIVVPAAHNITESLRAEPIARPPSAEPAAVTIQAP